MSGMEQLSTEWTGTGTNQGWHGIPISDIFGEKKSFYGWGYTQPKRESKSASAPVRRRQRRHLAAAAAAAAALLQTQQIQPQIHHIVLLDGLFGGGVKIRRTKPNADFTHHSKQQTKKATLPPRSGKMQKLIIGQFSSQFLICCCLFLCSSLINAEEENMVKQEQKQMVVNRPDIAFCEGSISAFFVSANVSVRGANASATISGSSEQQCAKYCADNRDNRGRTLLCGSALYESDTRQCKLYRKASAPDGELKRFAENGRRYYEKFCLPDDVPMDCAFTHFARVDDHILKGYAQSTSTVPTLAECMAYCMHEREFECKSAMYFYEEGECITNVESATTAPSDFQRPEDDDKVVLIENGCMKQEGNAAQNVSPSFAIEEQKDNDEATAETTTKTAITPTISEQQTTASSSVAAAQSILVTDASTIVPTSSSSSASPPPPQTTQSPAISFMTLMNKEENVNIKHGEDKGLKLEENSGQIAAELKAFEEAQSQLGNISPIGIGPARLHPKQLNEEATRQYGAKTIERASDGSFQEKEVSHTATPISSENLSTNANNNNNNNISTAGIRLISRKGPESTKRLHLKLIKERQQRPRPFSTEILPSETVSLHTVPAFGSGSSVSTLSPPPQPTTTVMAATQQQHEIVALDDGSPEERFEGSEGYFSLWGPWTPCTMPGERRVRRRKCLDLRRCKGSLMQVDYCPRDIPAVEDEPQLSAEVQQAPILTRHHQPIQVPVAQRQTLLPPPPALTHTGPVQHQQEVPKRRPVSIDIGTGTVLDTGGDIRDSVAVAQPPAVQPEATAPKEQQQLQKTQPAESVPVGAPATRPTEQREEQQQQQPAAVVVIDSIWSPWNGTCQHFASTQPCREGKVIGFEARECVAKDPLVCKGPFFSQPPVALVRLLPPPSVSPHYLLRLRMLAKAGAARPQKGIPGNYKPRGID
ncbi:hypothetical protein niasHS_016203 [Heterodera schachtii]|uniref:Apple domain-containing protein n=1 Tax=Heterodera schachtii TaxID=97005 RepID=A0ABD2I0Y7_HETSC